MTDDKQEKNRGTALGAQYNPLTANCMENKDHFNSEIIPGFDKLESLNFFDEIY